MTMTVRGSALATLLDQAPEGVRVLSLDCFDTLLWRNVQAPQDVFADLALEGGAVWPRMRAESRARRAAALEGVGEVTIAQIYRDMWPGAGDERIDQAIAAELAAEARHCFGFAPTVDLIRAAKQRGLQVIVVSDTYLSQDQLRTLIARAAGQDVADLIDRIFCSCEHGVGKAGGLFEHVLTDLRVPGNTILHVGDNKAADVEGPEPFGVWCAHFAQFDHECDQRLRLEAAAASLIDGDVRASTPVYQPHRPQLALRDEDEPVRALGHDVLGPLMHAFALWVKCEADEMAARLGKPVKLLFMLRDGYLPQLVYEAAFGTEPRTHSAEISRFTARRASFTDKAGIRTFLQDQKEHGRIEYLSRQLLLSQVEGVKLAGGRTSGATAQAAFAKAVLEPRNVAKIVERSKQFGDRMIAHLKRAGIEQGDAVMLVDLGYNGTVQNMIEPVLAERMGITLAGRYLLLREEYFSGLDKRGLIDQRHYDNRVVHSLCSPIAVVEQLCTVAQGSVVDYAPDGAPRRKESDVKGAQNDLRDHIQEGCVAFAREADRGFVRAPASDDADCRRRMAGAILARLLFMPTAAEVEIFGRFHHDVNLGTSDLVQMMDVEGSSAGLRRKGLSYLNDTQRIYLPGELQPHGLPLNLALFSVHRFGLDLRSSDFRVGEIKLPVFLADNRGQTAIQAAAHLTHDGYYLATIPVGPGRFAAGIQIGALCEWIQIDEVGFYPVKNFIAKRGELAATMIPAEVVHDGMEEQAPGLFRCEPGALLLAPPAKGIDKAPHLLSIVFRPLVWREANEIRKAA